MATVGVRCRGPVGRERFRRGKAVCGLRRELPEHELSRLAEDETLSIAAVPIIVDGEWWGMIGFDECAFERVWTPGDIDGLRAAASAIAAAIHASRAADELRAREAEYRAVFEATGDGLVISDLQGRLVAANPAFYQMHGYRRPGRRARPPVACPSRRQGIEVVGQLGNEPDVPLAIKESLYRVAQEALHNVAKHANAAHVSVGLTRGRGLLKLDVRDDGGGFATAASFSGHLGQSMRERAVAIGGTLSLTSSPGAGTRLVVGTPADVDQIERCGERARRDASLHPGSSWQPRNRDT